MEQRIKLIRIYELAAAMHVQYHVLMMERLKGLGADALGLPETLMEAYTQAIEAEQDYVNRPLRSAYTERLEELDHERDGIVSDILGRLRGAQYSSDATVKAAYPELKRQLIERYPAGINAENYQKQTALVSGLLVDLDKVNPAVLKTLGVDTLAETLKGVNERFTKTFMSRTSERARQAATALSDLRAATDEAYALIVLELEYTAARTTAHLDAIADGAEREKAAARRALAQRAVAETNETIRYYNAHYLSRTAATAPEGSDSDAPTEGAEGDATGDGDKPATGPTDVTEVL